MKRYTIEFDQCRFCPHFTVLHKRVSEFGKTSIGFYCERMPFDKKVGKLSMIELNGPIPDWCPLPDGEGSTDSERINEFVPEWYYKFKKIEEEEEGD